MEGDVDGRKKCGKENRPKNSMRSGMDGMEWDGMSKQVEYMHSLCS